MALQDVPRGASSAGFAREQDDARGAEHRNQGSVAAVPSYPTLSYGAATELLANGSVHGDLSCTMLWRVLRTIRQSLQ
jgi:hypothetical protein